MQWFLKRLSLSGNGYYDWRHRYGKDNIAQQLQPKSHWLSVAEREEIVEFSRNNPCKDSIYMGDNWAFCSAIKA